MSEEYSSSFFEQIVRDAVRDIQSKGSAYCFSEQQVDAIKKRIQVIGVRVEDGIYYLKGEMSDGKYSKKKSSKPIDCTN